MVSLSYIIGLRNINRVNVCARAHLCVLVCVCLCVNVLSRFSRHWLNQTEPCWLHLKGVTERY